MKNKLLCVFSRYAVDGNIDDVKFVEIEGKKYEADDKGEAKKDDKGELVPFVEKKPNNTDVKVEEMSLDDLVKINPSFAKFMGDHKTMEADLNKIKNDLTQKEKDELEKKGEWQKLATDRGAELETAKTEIGKRDEIIGKYTSTVDGLLKSMLNSIPKEKQSLIPADYSNRQKLEYIIANQKILGVKTGVGGDKIDPNEGQPAGTDEEKLVNEIEELRKKPNKTRAEENLLWEKAKKLKELREAKSK